MRTIIIGDIHGCDQKLHALLDKVQPVSEDRLILLGDLFDRGPESWEVYQTIMKLEESYGDRFILLRGNHEDYLLMENLTFSQRMAWNQAVSCTSLLAVCFFSVLESGRWSGR